MEFEGAIFLYNLSILAATFAVVSALVMLMRQTMGGQLSAFDTYLTSAFVALGFVIAISAIVPPLLAFFHLPLRAVWGLGSVTAAALLGYVNFANARHRSEASARQRPPAVMAAFMLQWACVALLVLNTILQGPALFAAALTISLATVMWSFVRRIVSLLGSRDDWNPELG